MKEIAKIHCNCFSNPDGWIGVRNYKYGVQARILICPDCNHIQDIGDRIYSLLVIATRERVGLLLGANGWIPISYPELQELFINNQEELDNDLETAIKECEGGYCPGFYEVDFYYHEWYNLLPTPETVVNAEREQEYAILSARRAKERTMIDEKLGLPRIIESEEMGLTVAADSNPGGIGLTLFEYIAGVYSSRVFIPASEFKDLKQLMERYEEIYDNL